ncbi:MAG TPA: VWA domain-containing protein [Candidatus Angelobacter sp.]|nr:VWA domain-containing protein [Candidatus Angelobacter sp.]
MRFASRLPFYIALILGSSFVLAQSSSQSDVYQSQARLKTSTRLVVVDVVATDSKGEPVPNLNVDDFTVLENGVPQKISDFTFQHSGQVKAVAMPQLAPNVVTNAPPFASGVLDVILFDSVNGEFSSQAYAKDQLAKFFSTAQLDRPVALFAMEKRIRMLHDFTTDATALKQAIEKYRQTAQGGNTESFESRESPFSTKGDYHTDERNIETTLNQLNALSKILGGYPGRKNLIWLSESFPLDLYPDTVIRGALSVADLEAGPKGGPQKTAPDVFDNMVTGGAFKDFASLVKKVAESMMKAQVAVYPVDAAGVGKNDHLASQHTANDMAQRTGGRAFHNTNDLAGSMQAGINDGGTYYTLSYYPENKKWDGQFRLIQVKIRNPGTTLRYRLGYYAIDQEKADKEETSRVVEDFSRALMLDSPALTSVRFQAGVVPPSSQTGNKLVVNFAVDPHTLQFQPGADGVQHGDIVCVVWAYGKNRDKPIASPGGSSKADLKPETFNQMMQRYYPCKQELQLKHGEYTLKLGVLDRNSNLMGTTITAVNVQ